MIATKRHILDNLLLILNFASLGHVCLRPFRTQGICLYFTLSPYWFQGRRIISVCCTPCTYTGRWREIYCLVNLPIKEVVNFFRMFLVLTGLLGVSSGKQSSAKQIVKQFTCHLCFCLSEKYE